MSLCFPEFHWAGCASKALGHARCLIDGTPCQDAAWSGQIGTAATWHAERRPRCFALDMARRYQKVPEGGREPHDLCVLSVVLTAKHHLRVPGCSCEHVDGNGQIYRLFMNQYMQRYSKSDIQCVSICYPSVVTKDIYIIKHYD